MTAAMEKERKPKLTEKQARMRDAVKYLQEYMRTYDGQRGYLDYSDKTFIDDVLYGLSMALGGVTHAGASGYDAFKDKLREHLGAARSLASPQVPVEAIRHGIDELDNEYFSCIAFASRFPEGTDSHNKWMQLAKAAEQHAYALRKLLPEEKADANART